MLCCVVLCLAVYLLCNSAYSYSLRKTNSFICHYYNTRFSLTTRCCVASLSLRLPLCHWPFTVSVAVDYKHIYVAIWTTWCNMTYFISNSPPISTTLTKTRAPSRLAIKTATLSRRETEFDAFKLGRLNWIREVPKKLFNRPISRYRSCIRFCEAFAISNYLIGSAQRIIPVLDIS
jgi:hypothetical protein